MYLSYNATFRLTFALSIMYLLFCSFFILLYDEVRHQQISEYIPFTPLAFKNDFSGFPLTCAMSRAFCYSSCLFRFSIRAYSRLDLCSLSSVESVIQFRDMVST